MLNFQTFSAWIVIDGVSSDEYDVEHRDVDGTMHVTCWIPSKVGKKFQVHFKDKSGSTSSAYVYIDGNKCGGRVLRPAKMSRSVDGLRVSSTVSKPFIFSNLSLTEEEDDMDGSGALSNVGQIEVTMGFVAILGNKPSMHGYQVPAERKFNEKAKKGLDHQTQFGEDIQHHHPVHVVRTKALGKDVVRFCFRYRPLEVLRALGIVPKAAAASASSQRTLKRRLSSDISEDVKPKIPEVIVLEDSGDEKPNRDRRKKIKRERVKSESLNIPISGEVIDLT